MFVSYLRKRFPGSAVHRANLDLVWQHLCRGEHAEVGVHKCETLVAFDLHQAWQLGEQSI